MKSFNEAENSWRDKPTGPKVRREHQMSFGTQLVDNGVRFRLWAPKHENIGVKLEGETEIRPMRALDRGWHELETSAARPGSLYRFVLPDGVEVPDPASRFQPQDVHGPSEVINPHAFLWDDTDWKGRSWEQSVIYELHVGSFTADGTFRAAMERLDYLRDLGVTAIELMPIADFPGERNWGYDGVLLFAPDSIYGRPEDLKALVVAAHARGISVLLDVVYNHFGPDGNYLPAYSHIFTEKHKTPWGAAINYDADHSGVVRDLVVNNAVYWIREYNLDGLRLDAVHAIMDESSTHVLEDIAHAARAAVPDRPVHLILENEENQASRLSRDRHGKPIQFTAQWNDDVHHVLHTAASGERSGYYADYVGDTEKLGRALAEGFAFQGEMMPYRGHPRGEPSATLSPACFVSFIQNHDQVGNRAFGDRITNFAPVAAVRAIAAIYLLAPQIPMIFMGEEWAAAQPFPFFCHFEKELADAVRNGRRAEFAKFPEFQDARQRQRIPDPTARETYLSAKLRWEDARDGAHAESLDWYRRVLAIRHAEIIPRLKDMDGNAGQFEVLGDAALVVRWMLGDSSELMLAANLKATALPGFSLPSGRILWSEGSAEAGQLAPWSVVWTLGGTT
jgi:malto-oligosyltrehalose trehalohydrolase